MQRLFPIIIICIIFFVFPFQCYIIGDGVGIGVQGAVFKYQITNYGNSLIPITSDIMYIVIGIYSGKTALSIILWALGTVLLTVTTIFIILHAKDLEIYRNRSIFISLSEVCCCYIASCIAQYGWLFNGPSGKSLPIGIIILMAWMIFFYKFKFDITKS